MTVGTKTFKGLGVPLWGEFKITQITLGTDIMTIEGVASQSGDFIVCRNSSETEKFVVDVNGDVTTAGTAISMSGGAAGTPALVGFGTLCTTAPTAGTVGQLFLLQDSTAVQLAATNASADLVYFALSTTTAIS